MNKRATRKQAKSETKRRPRILIGALWTLVVTAGCEAPNLESTGGGYEPGSSSDQRDAAERGGAGASVDGPARADLAETVP